MEHEVILAASGVDALLAAARHTPDLIVLDVKMPGMDGFETCLRLRADPELSGIPVLFATSQDTLSDKLEVFDAGADEYVIKPFLREVLIHNVERLLPGGSPDDEAAS